MEIDRLTPEQCRVRINNLVLNIERFNSLIDDIVKTHIPDFHYLEYSVSPVRNCDRSPVGVCIWRKEEDEDYCETVCRYCFKAIDKFQ